MGMSANQEFSLGRIEFEGLSAFEWPCQGPGLESTESEMGLKTKSLDQLA